MKILKKRLTPQCRSKHFSRLSDRSPTGYKPGANATKPASAGSISLACEGRLCSVSPTLEGEGGISGLAMDLTPNSPVAPYELRTTMLNFFNEPPSLREASANAQRFAEKTPRTRREEEIERSNA